MEPLLQGGRKPRFSLAYMKRICPHARRLLMHCALAACCRARLIAGRSMAINTAIIPMTTSSSTSVKPRDLGFMAAPFSKADRRERALAHMRYLIGLLRRKPLY